MRQHFEVWLDDDEHTDRWYAKNPFTATGRQDMITHWAGDVYIKFCSPQYYPLRWKLFEKNGMPYQFGWINDHLMKPEGLHDYDYTVSPPTLFMQLSSSQSEAETDEPAEMPDFKGINNSGNDNDEPHDDAEEERVNLDNFNLVDRRLKVLYNNGWFKGDIYISTHC